MAINYKNYSAPDGQALTLAFKFIAPVALDSRFAIDDIKGMLSEGVWKNNGTYLGYNGLLTYVGDNTLNIKKQYVLTDAGAHSKHLLTNKQLACINAITDRIPKPENILENLLGIPTSFTVISEGDNADPTFISELEKYWTNLASAGDVTASLEPLAGVFQFKGVASSIDKDFTTITITPLEYNSKTFGCVGYEYDYAHDKYKKWEASDNTVVYTKDGDSTRKIYTKGSSSDVLYVEHNGIVYYYDGVSNNKTKFTALEETSIYAGSTLSTNSLTSTTFYSSDTTQTSATTMFTETPRKYTASSFSITENTYTDGTGTEQNASSVNTGAVYLVGDKEYASNGLIWVELGSPDSDNNWIVL